MRVKLATIWPRDIWLLVGYPLPKHTLLRVGPANVALASKPVKSLAPSLAPAASAAASGSSLAFSEAPYYGMNPSTPAVISGQCHIPHRPESHGY